MKKLTALFLALALCLSLCTVTAFADDSQAGQPLCFTAAGAGTIALIKHDYIDPYDTVELDPISLQYSTDGSAWLDYTVDTTVSFSVAGDKVYFKAKEVNKTFSKNSSNHYYFTVSGTTVAASGDVTTLLDANGVTNLADTTGGKNWVGCFASLFEYCPLTTAPVLPATTLADSCYYGMFYNCTELTKAPALPATTLAGWCYEHMFVDCTELTTAPASLPATTLDYSCYNSMFKGCKKLATAPELPATTLADHCYENMFSGCDLEAAPELPATTLADSCYNCMFINCKKLATAPALPATTLKTACYANMFYGCSSLETAPVLPATELVSGCYAFMFNGCTSLKNVNVAFTDWKDDVKYNGSFTPTDNWLGGVLTTGGTFTCPAALTDLAAHGVPTGWNSVRICSVTFDANGHGTAPAAITNVASGTTISKPTDPTEAGYTFGGWYKETGCTNAWNFATDKVTADTTLYAKWTATGGGHHHGGTTTTPTVTSATTADAGIALYGVLTVSSLLGMGWVSKKKH